jgi:WD40 repeat protein/uncharacterized caspase-like protein
VTWEYKKTNFDRNLAVVIGIDRYENHPQIHRLRTPVNDAKALAELLEKEYEYKPENVVRLFDEAATLTGLQTLLNDTLPNQLKPTKGDRLIFYFAGHGIPRNSEDGPKGYLVPQDADWQKEGSFLAMSQVYEALSKLECHHLLVILDCCFAGTFRWAGRRKVIPILETVRKEHYDRFIRYPAWQVITSAAHDQEALDVAKLAQDKRGEVPDEKQKLREVPDEKQKLHSPFALALLEGLRENKADMIPDGVITAHELYVYLDQHVSQLSGSRQKPGIYPMRLEYDRGEFVFTKPGFTSEQLKPAPLLNESNNPYRGLASFDEKHANFFFGRKILVEQLQHRLSQANRSLTVVLGVSGSGKSSLIKAGLIPELRVFALNLIKACILTETILAAFPQLPLKLLPIYYVQQWYILDPIRPDRYPFTALARAILPIDKPELIEQLSQIGFLDEVFKSKDESGQDQGEKPTDAEFVKLAEFWNSATPEAKLLVVEDYFEQLLKRCRNPQEKEHLSQLYRAIFEQLESLSNRLQNKPQHLTSVIRKWSETHPDAKLLLTIDQFEELITMSQESQTETHGGDREQSDRAAESQPWLPFLQVLREAIVECSQQLHIVLTLRSDFEPRFLSSPLSAYWKDARFPVRAMNLDELRQAIEGPALKQALYFEPPELVGKLIDEVGQMPGALPLLSFTLSELYAKLHERWKPGSTDRALRIKDYEELGGVAGALTRRATEEYEALDEKHRATMRRMMLRMVVIEGGGVARRRVPESELVYPDLEENKRVAQVSDRLVKARLLVKGQETGEPYVEPAHDFLVRGWDKLQKWIKEEQEDLALQQRLTPAANDWSTDKGGLWTREPERLARLEKILISRNQWLNKIEIDFVNASIKQRFDELEEAKRQRDKAIQGQVDALNSLSEANYSQNDHLGALVASVKAGKVLQSQNEISLPVASQFRTVLGLHQAVYGAVEHNRLNGGTNNECSICFSPDGNLIAFSTMDGTIQIWSKDGSLQKTLPGRYKGAGARGFTVNFNPDGKTITSNYWAGGTQILDLNGLPYTCEEELYYPGRQSTDKKSIKIRYTTNFNIIDCSILTFIDWKQLWCKNSIIKKIETEHNNERVSTVCFSPDGKFVASASADQTVKIWKIDGTLLSTVQEHTNSVLDVVFSSDGEQIVSIANENTVVIWSLNEGLIGKFNLNKCDGHLGRVLSVSFSLDGKSLISVGSDNTVKFWNNHGSLLNTRFWQGEGTTDISFSPDGKIFAATYSSGSVRLWSTEAILPKTIIGHGDGWFPNSISKVRFSPDGKVIVGVVESGGEEGNLVKVWSADGSFQSTLASFSSATYINISFSKDSKICAISADRYGVIGVYGSDGIFFHSDASNFLDKGNGCISPDAKTITTVTGTTIKIWSFNGTSIEQVLKIFDTSQSYDHLIDISFDGQVVAIANYEAISLWKLNGTLLKTIEIYGTRSISFSPNAQIVAIASADSTVKLYRTDDDSISPVQVLTGHTSVATDVCFSFNGQIIASASMDKTIKIWSLDGSLLRTLEGHDSYVNSVSFSSDGKTLASASSDGTIILWNFNLDELLMLGCHLLKKFLKTNFKISQEDRSICSNF